MEETPSSIPEKLVVKSYVAARPMRDPETGVVIYRVQNNLQLIMDPGGEIMDANGRYHQIRPTYVQFSRGKYETSDKAIQDFIEGHADFKEGTIFCLNDREAQERMKNAQGAESAPHIRKLRTSTLKKMTKEELIEYADSIGFLGGVGQPSKDDAELMKREEFIAYLGA